MAIPILGRGDIPTPSELQQMKDQAARNDETESEREVAARHFEAIRCYFHSAPRCGKWFRQELNVGKWANFDFDVRRVRLDGDGSERWVCLQWYKKPGLFRELGALPYPIYVHETRMCRRCRWTGVAAKDECPECFGGLTPGVYRGLDREMIRCIHEEYNLQSPMNVLARVNLARANHQYRLLKKEMEISESQAEVVDHVGHEMRKFIGIREFEAVPKGNA